MNHDIDDAVRAGVLIETDLPPGPLAVLGPHPGARITTMVNDMVRTSAGADDDRHVSRRSGTR